MAKLSLEISVNDKETLRKFKDVVGGLESMGKTAQKVGESMEKALNNANAIEVQYTIKPVVPDQGKLAPEILRLQREIEQSKIDLMADGAEKRLAQIDLDYNRQIDRVNEWAEKLRQAQGGELTDEQTVKTNDGYSAVLEQRLKAERQFYDQKAQQSLTELDKEKLGWENVYKEYQESRLAITKDYDDRIKNVQDGSEKDLAKQKDEVLQKLDTSILEKSDLWINLFKDASKLTNTFIGDIISDTENLIDYLKGKEGATIPVGFKEDDLQALKGNTKFIENIFNGLKKQRDEFNKQNPFNQLIEGFKLLGKTSDDTGKKLDKAARSEALKQGISDIEKGFTGVNAILKDAGDTIGAIFGDKAGDIGKNIVQSIEGMGEAAGGAARLMAGDLSGAAGMISGVGKLVKGIGGLFGDGSKDKERLEEIDRYKKLIGIYDKLITKHQEYMKSLSGGDAIKQAEQAEALLRRREEAERQKLATWLKTGASRNHHSMGYRINRDLKSELAVSGIKDISEVLRYDDEQWKKLQMNIALWEKLPPEVREYGESVIQSKENIEELGLTLRESLTGISFQSLQDSLNELVFQGDLAAEDIGKSFEGHMSKAIQNVVKSKFLSDKLLLWYEDFEKAMSDGVLSEDEVNSLRKQYNNIVNNANEAYQNAMKAAGLEITSDSSTDNNSSGSSGGGIQGVTQDTMSEVLGQLRAMRLDWAEVSESMKAIRLAGLDLSGMGSDMSLIQTNTFDLKNLAQSQLNSLVQIERNTFRTANGIHEILDNGVKIKESH